MKILPITGLIISIALIGSIATARGDTEFTYQGELMENGGLANGSFNFDFSLWDDAIAGNQVDSTISLVGVLVVNGKFTVELDFGAAAFDNSDRWLEITVESVTLSPRNPVTRAPYAIQTRGINVASDEDVSIGTSSNLYRFQVYTDDRERAIYGNNFNNGTGVKFGVYGRATSVDGYGLYGLHDAPTGTNAGVYGETDSSSANAVAVHGVVDTTSPGSFSAAVRGENRGTGATGIGVFGSHDGQGWGLYGTTNGGLGRGVFGEVLGSGGVAGYFRNDDGIAVFADGADNNGSTAALTVSSGSQTMYLDGNEIDSNSASGLYLNNNNSNDVVLAAGGGDVLVPHANSLLRVEGPISARSGTFGYNATAGPMITTRGDNDGAHTVTHIRFESFAVAGTITSNNGVVSYNAFTGSHYASILAPLEPGTLVRMTGSNHAISDARDSEPVYGVETTTRANDPACLGAYLGDHGNLHAEDGAKIHLVAAVGNGTMWGVDDGRGNIEPGDLLISSDVPGCAMKDDPARFATGYVLARAAQRVDWAKVTPDSGGVRRSKISVLFDASVRTSTAAMSDPEMASLSRDNDALRERLSNLETIVNELKAQITESTK